MFVNEGKTNTEPTRKISVNKFLGNSRKLEFDVNVLPNRFRAKLST